MTPERFNQIKNDHIRDGNAQAWNQEHANRAHDERAELIKALTHYLAMEKGKERADDAHRRPQRGVKIEEIDDLSDDYDQKPVEDGDPFDWSRPKF